MNFVSILIEPLFYNIWPQQGERRRAASLYDVSIKEFPTSNWFLEEGTLKVLNDSKWVRDSM